jgi:hypothetical protein
MEPCMWWMIVLHMRKASTLDTPTHHVFYSDIKTTSLYQSMESTCTQTIVCVCDVFPDREVRVWCYAREHGMLCQTLFGHMFGIGARQRPPGGAEVDLHAREAVCHGTRVNVISHLVSASEYGPPLKGGHTLVLRGGHIFMVLTKSSFV